MSFIMPGFWYTLRVLIHQVFTVQSLKAGCGFDCSEEKLGLMYSSFIYIAALRKQVEAYTDWVHFSCTMHLQHNYISPTSVILALLCDIFYSTQREVHNLMGILRGSFWSCSKHSQHMFYHYIGSCCEHTPLGEWKSFHVWSWLLTGI